MTSEAGAATRTTQVLISRLFRIGLVITAGTELNKTKAIEIPINVVSSEPVKIASIRCAKPSII